MVGYWGLGGTIMFKSIVNAVVNSNSVAVKVVGYTALAAVGIGADIIGASAKKAEEVKVAAPATEEIVDVVTEVKVAEAPAPVTEDILEEVIHDDDIVVEVVRENPVEEYNDSADREAENELFEAAIKSTSDSFVMACEEAIETRAYGDEEAAVAMEEMAKLYLDYLHINLGKEDECLMVDNVRKALAAFRAFGPKRIEWM